jgi:hypothetical protein
MGRTFPLPELAVGPLHSTMTQVPGTQANLIVRSWVDAPHLKRAALAIEQAVWSNLGYLSYSRSHYEYYAELLDTYPECQLCLVDNELGYPVAVANSVPFVCGGPDDLPPEGWDWLVETAARNNDRKPNMLGGLRGGDDSRPRRFSEEQRIKRCCGARSSNGESPASLGPYRGLHSVDRRQRATL